MAQAELSFAAYSYGLSLLIEDILSVLMVPMLLRKSSRFLKFVSLTMMPYRVSRLLTH